MIFRELAVPDSIRDRVLCGWFFAVTDDDPETVEHVIVPDGSVSISVMVPPGGPAMLGFAGPSLRAHVTTVRAGFGYAGARLQPGVAPALLARPASALVGAFGALEGAPADVEALKPILAALATEQTPWPALAEQLAALAGDWPTPAPAITAAAAELMRSHGRHPIAALAGRSGLGPRQFRRRFAAATGLAPKQFATAQRIRRAMTLWLEGELEWSAIAQQAGFADQSQLIRDCGEIFGAPPGEVSRYIGRIEHQLLDPFVQSRQPITG